MPFTRQMKIAFPLVLAACGGSAPAGPADLVGSEDHDLRVAMTRQAVRLGEPIPATLINGGAGPAFVGALDCTAELERQVGSEWVRLHSLRMCIEIAIEVPGGRQLDFRAVGPDETGVYRIAFEAYHDGEQVTVRSPAFAVE